jgi:thiol-disulfide isomerase/thioredoxin
MIRSAALLALAASTTTTITALELTPDTFHKETEGKTVFIKFFAPWCGKYLLQ